MHRTISGDLQDEEEMDRAMEEAGEEAIFQVEKKLSAIRFNTFVHSLQHPCCLYESYL